MDWGLFWSELLRVTVAVLLCGVIGIERQYHLKNAGLRTHSLVGLGACLFTIVGTHPWAVSPSTASGDPMRVAAQVVTGIGFLGAGLIFVNRDVVRGLTTAASIWVSAAIGMACGAGMMPLAAATSVVYLVLMVGLARLAGNLPTRDRHMLVRLAYDDKSGTLRRILTTATEMQFESAVLSTRQIPGSAPPRVEVVVRFSGGVPLTDLVAELSEVPGVRSADLFEDTRQTED